MTQVKESFFELFKNIAGASLVLAALLYVAGWTHLKQYYKAFGLDILELGIPLYNILIYSVPVIFYNNWSWMVILGGILILGIALNNEWLKSKSQSALGSSLMVITIMLMGLGLSRWGAYVGLKKAHQDLLLTTSDLPTIAVDIMPEQNKQGNSEDNGFNSLEFKLLMHTKDNCYFFKPVSKEYNFPVGQVDLYVIPNNRIRRIHIQRGIK